MARALAREAAAQVVVVSGLARGIDTEAHQAALEAGGVTWAVLGGGLGRLYPPENEPLARRIVETGGCLISEHPDGEEPRPGYFPRRNRVISGLSWGTVVVEGAAQSGSLITARCAVEQGREVFAVPGPADSALSAACHQLLREGAMPLCAMRDIWHLLPPACRPSSQGAPRPARGLPQAQEKILELLGPDALTVEELVKRAGLDLSGLSNILLDMEFQDLVEALPGQRYAKKGN
jgi:DNA processing protein